MLHTRTQNRPDTLMFDPIFGRGPSSDLSHVGSASPLRPSRCRQEQVTGVGLDKPPPAPSSQPRTFAPAQATTDALRLTLNNNSAALKGSVLSSPNTHLYDMTPIAILSLSVPTGPRRPRPDKNGQMRT